MDRTEEEKGNIHKECSAVEMSDGSERSYPCVLSLVTMDELPARVDNVAPTTSIQVSKSDLRR